MILYQLYLKNQENKLLTGAVAELHQTGNGSRSWLKNTEEISENNNNITYYGYMLNYKAFQKTYYRMKD